MLSLSFFWWFNLLLLELGDAIQLSLNSLPISHEGCHLLLRPARVSRVISFTHELIQVAVDTIDDDWVVADEVLSVHDQLHEVIIVVFNDVKRFASGRAIGIPTLIIVSNEVIQ
jgi:hypothetical protein